MADVLGDDEEPSTQELDRIGRELDDRRERLRRHALAEASYDYSIAAGRWFDGRREAVHNEVVEKDGEELATVQWDRFLIHVKIMRALTGRDEDPEATLAKAWDDYFKSGSGNAGDPPRSRD
jgi:hypothetical protein